MASVFEANETIKCESVIQLCIAALEMIIDPRGRQIPHLSANFICQAICRTLRWCHIYRLRNATISTIISCSCKRRLLQNWQNIGPLCLHANAGPRFVKFNNRHS